MKKNKVLIVEDESIVALEMQKILQELNYEITTLASDYHTALKSIKENTPDLILMDINLNSEKDGINIVQKIENLYKIPVIYTTAYSDERTLNRAIKTNPVSYLIKPFKREELKSNILLGLYKSKKSNYLKPNSEALNLGYDYFYELNSNKLYYKDMYIKLGRKERKLLKLLIKAEGNLVTFKYLEYEIWDGNIVSHSTLRTLIYRLRSKLHFELIETISNLGCRINIK